MQNLLLKHPLIQCACWIPDFQGVDQAASVEFWSLCLFSTVSGLISLSNQGSNGVVLKYLWPGSNPLCINLQKFGTVLTRILLERSAGGMQLICFSALTFCVYASIRQFLPELLGSPFLRW